jgi:hypothetical protein
MKKAWVIVLTVLVFAGCAPVESIKQETTLFLKESDYSAIYKASPRTERTGLNVYGGYDCTEFDFVMEKPYGIKITDNVKDSLFHVEIKNILTGETGCVMIGDLTKMTPNEIKVLNQEIKKAEELEEQKELRQLQSIFKLAVAITQAIYPCPRGGAHDTVNYLGIEPMGGGEYRKHYKCSKCGRKYTRGGKF